MKKKKLKFGIIITLLLATFAYNSFAYNLFWGHPTTKNLSYYTNGMTSDQKLATLYAAAAWSNVSNGITFTRSGDSTGFVYFTDARSDIKFDDFANYIDYYIPQYTSPLLYQTMYYSVNDAMGNNLTYYWRTLESDDINGVQAVAAKIK